MASVTIRVEGLAELQANLVKFGEKMAGQIVTDALKAGGELIRDEARQRAPVLEADTLRRRRGALRSGITSYAIQWNKVIVRVRNRGYVFDKTDPKARRPGNPNYWWLVEFGASQRKASPFMRPAFEARKLEAIEVIRAHLAKNIQLAAAGMYRVRTRVRGRWK